MPTPRTILLVQDDPHDAEAIRTSLTTEQQQALQVVWVRRCSEALDLLGGRPGKRAAPFAAILVDLFLPDASGMVTFERLYEAAPHVPIVLLCSSEHEPIARQAVQRGAQDYLLKSHLDSYWLSKMVVTTIDRAINAEALFVEQERAQVTLNSIGDAVMSCDVDGRVTYLNRVAELLTGWVNESAVGRDVDEVFHVIETGTRAAVVNPMAIAMLENKTVLLAPNSLLCRRDGVEAAIEDSAAPIHDRHGRVTGAVMVFHDVSATRALSLRISHHSQHDTLTDLPNRMLLDDRLLNAIQLAKRHGTTLAVMFLDLDRFKNVNDSLGHGVGDQLLRLVARTLLGCMRSSDTVSRQGGDEFVVLLSELTHGQDAAITAEKILLALSRPFSIDGRNLHVSASIGIGVFPGDGEDGETLMKHADIAMYHAKDCGRSNYQFFREDMNARALQRQAIEDGLRQALERNEFVLHYQPVVDLWSGAVTGVEALIRWQHPTRGLMLPALFVPIAEECGLIVAIGRWVLLEACRQNRLWQEAGLPQIRIAINVSAAELRHKDFVASVVSGLADSGLSPEYLDLELTETFLMQDSASTALVLRSLKDLGVHLTLDDFGTGYSSLSHLKGFPIDSLKIDQAFVGDLTSNPNDLSIVRAVIGLGFNLQIRVIAEGIETAAQFELLQHQHCPEGQGYFLGRPTTGARFPDMVAQIADDICKRAPSNGTHSTQRARRPDMQ
ncbi:MAG: EAL domain-containing protein [Pseudomonadota bacterium]